MENKRIAFALKSWLTILYKETRKIPQNMQERSTRVRLEKLLIDCWTLYTLVIDVFKWTFH